MTKEAEAHAKEDQEKRGKVEARNAADSLIFTSEKSLNDAGEKVEASLKKEVEDKIASLKAILDTGTKEDLEAKSKDLSDSLQKVGQAMYQSQKTEDRGQKTEEATGNSEKKPDSDKKDAEKQEPVEGEVVE